MKLEVGMYVRTTYGIGKITRAYLIYDDGGSLWHLAYMTDNPNIEIAIYTEEKSWKLFSKVQNNLKIKYEPIDMNMDLVEKVYKQKLEIVCYVPVDNDYPRNAELFDNHKFIKASSNIMELLEDEDIAVINYINEFGKEVINKSFIKIRSSIDMISFEMVGLERICYFKNTDEFVYVNSNGDVKTKKHDLKFKIIKILTEKQFEANAYTIEKER